MKISDAGISLIKRFEGLELEAYRDIAGIWTIGYGHTGPDVREGMRISEREAEELLKHDLRPREEAVAKLASVALNQNEFDALVSFVYNVGIEAFRKSTARRRLNANDRVGAAEALTWWNKATVSGVLREVRGLTRRRAAERALFLEPVERPVVANNNQIAENSRITPIEDAPRRPNLAESRSIQGATVAGGAGVASSTIGRENANALNEIQGGAAAGTGDMPDSSASGGSAEVPGEGTVTEGGATGGGSDAPVASTGGGSTDVTTGGAPTDAPTPSLAGASQSIEVDADRPVFEKESAEAQIQLALLILIVLSVAYIFFARLDDWWRYRR